MSNISVSIIHAFTDGEHAKGNPAGVCLLDRFPEDAVLQSIAKQINLSETAFLVRISDNHYALRWFTPTTEVPLCGHGTLAAAHYLRQHALSKNLMNLSQPLQFDTLSGTLEAEIVDQGISLTFPRKELRAATDPQTLADCIDVPVEHSFRSDASYVVEVSDMDTLKRCKPNLNAICKLDSEDLIVTCRGGNGYDYAYRCFCPQIGIDEDPVTGSANCTLAPYWANKLGRTSMKAFQASANGGVLSIALKNDAVELTGRAIKTHDVKIDLTNTPRQARAI